MSRGRTRRRAAYPLLPRGSFAICRMRRPARAPVTSSGGSANQRKEWYRRCENVLPGHPLIWIARWSDTGNPAWRPLWR
jgi:hypothetical protein